MMYDGSDQALIDTALKDGYLSVEEAQCTTWNINDYLDDNEEVYMTNLIGTFKSMNKRLY